MRCLALGSRCQRQPRARMSTARPISQSLDSHSLGEQYKGSNNEENRPSRLHLSFLPQFHGYKSGEGRGACSTAHPCPIGQTAKQLEEHLNNPSWPREPQLHSRPKGPLYHLRLQRAALTTRTPVALLFAVFGKSRRPGLVLSCTLSLAHAGNEGWPQMGLSKSGSLQMGRGEFGWTFANGEAQITEARGAMSDCALRAKVGDAVEPRAFHTQASAGLEGGGGWKVVVEMGLLQAFRIANRGWEEKGTITKS